MTEEVLSIRPKPCSIGSMAQIWAGRRLVPAHLRGQRARAKLLKAQAAALADNDLKAWRRPTAVLLCLDGRCVVQIADPPGVHNSAVSKGLGAYLSRGFDALIPGTSPGVWKTTRRTTKHNRYFGSPAERDAALRTTFEQFKREPALIEGHVRRFRASGGRCP